MAFEDGVARALGQANYVDESQKKIQQPSSFTQSVIDKAQKQKRDLTQAYELAKQVGASSLMGGDLSAISRQAEIKRREEERLKAEQQSAFTQFGNMLVQTIGSELVLGIAEGITRIPDMFVQGYNGITGENVEFYNPIADAIASAADYIREDLAPIHRTTDKNLAFGEFGWWMQGIPSVVSTLTLLFPTLGEAKALSYLGKISTINRRLRSISKGLAKTISKVENGVTKTSRGIEMENAMSRVNELRNIAKWDKRIRNFANTTEQAFLSRVNENLQEANGTRKEVYETSLNTLQNMSQEEYDKFIKNNPEYKDQSIDDIAKDIAGKAANYTFNHDFWMLANDILEFGIAKNIFKQMAAIPTTKATQRYANEKLAEMTGKKVEDIAAKKNILQNFLPSAEVGRDWAKTAIIEGFEEGFQGGVNTMAKEYAKQVIDKGYDVRTINSIINDSETWDQAFWGAFGGILFNGGYKYVNSAFRKAGAILKHKMGKMSDTDYENVMQGEQQRAKSAIDARIEKTQKFINDVNLINQGFNPYNTIRDDYGEIQLGEDGKPQYETIDFDERGELLDRARRNFLRDITLNAIDAGQYNLLKDYLTSSALNDYLADRITDYNSESEKEANKRLFDEAQVVYDSYIKNLNSVEDNITEADLREGDFKLENHSPSIDRLMAREMTIRELAVQDAMSEYESENSKLNNPLDNFILLKEAEKWYNQILKKERDLDRKKDKMTKPAVDSIRKAIQAEKNRLGEFLRDNMLVQDKESFDEMLRQTIKEVGDFGRIVNMDTIGHVLQDIFDSISNEDVETNAPWINTYISSQYEESERKQQEKTAQALVRAAKIRSQLPRTRKDFIDAYEELGVQFDSYVKDRMSQYMKKIEDYISEGKTIEEIDDRVDRLFEMSGLPEYNPDTGTWEQEEGYDEDLFEALLATKLGATTRAYYYGKLREFISHLKQDRLKEAAEEELNNRTQIEGNGEVTVAPAETTTTGGEEVVQQEGTEVEEQQPVAISPSTGEEQIDNTDIWREDSFDYNSTVYENTKLAIDIINKLIAEEDISEELKNSSPNDAVYKDFLNKIKDRLRRDTPSLTYDVIRESSENALELFINLMNRENNAETQLRLGLRLDEEEHDGTRNSVIHMLTDEEFASAFDDLITQFSIANGMPKVTRDGKEYRIVSLHDLANYLIHNNNLSLNECTRILTKLYKLFNNPTITNKYVFVNYEELLTNIKDYLYRLSIAKQNRLNDNSFRVNYLSRQYIASLGLSEQEYYKRRKAALEEIYNTNDPNFIKIEDPNPNNVQGREDTLIFYVNITYEGKKTKVPIGGVAKVNTAEESNTNNVFSIKPPSSGGFAYRIEQTAAGYVSNLDFIFENINESPIEQVLVNYLSRFINFKRTNDTSYLDMSDEDVRILLNDDKVIQLINSGLLTPPGTRIAKKGKREFEWVDGGSLRDHFDNDKDLANYIVTKLATIRFGISFENLQRQVDLGYLLQVSERDWAESYMNWKIKVWENFKQTKALQDAIKEKGAENIGIGLANSFKILPNTVKDENGNFQYFSIAETFIKAKKNHTSYQVCYCEGGKILRENGDATNPILNDIENSPYSMGTKSNNGTGIGIVIEEDNYGYFQDINGEWQSGQKIPIIMWLNESNVLNRSNKAHQDLLNKLGKELSRIFRDHYNGGDFNTTYNKLKDLIGVNGIFYGYTVTKGNGVIQISSKHNGNNYVVSIFKNSNSSSGPGDVVISKKNASSRNYVQIMKLTASTQPGSIARMLTTGKVGEEQIIDALRFRMNTNFVNKSRGNAYITKAEKGDGFTLFEVKDENGNVIEEGIPYMNFLDYVLSNNAFNSTVTADSNGNLVTYHVMGYKQIIVSPNLERTIEDEQINKFLGVKLGNKTSRAKWHGVNQVYKGRDFIEILNDLSPQPLTDEQIDLLFGTDTTLGLLPNEFYVEGSKYDNEGHIGVLGRYKDGKIRITPLGLQVFSHDRLEFIRVLIHENFHRYWSRYDSNGYGRRRLIPEILGADGLIARAQAALKNYNADPVIKKYLESMLKELSSVENYKHFNDEVNLLPDSTEEERAEKRARQERILAEEFIVESFTDRHLAEFLNSVQYSGADTNNVESKNKSLLQRLIDLIVRFFNTIKAFKIEKNSILAREYELLSKKLDTRTLENKGNQIEDTTNGEQNSDNSSSSNQTYRSEDDLMFSSFIRPVETMDIDEIELEHHNKKSIVDTTNVVDTSSMFDFVNDFKSDIKAALAQMVTRGEVKYACQ